MSVVDWVNENTSGTATVNPPVISTFGAPAAAQVATAAFPVPRSYSLPPGRVLLVAPQPFYEDRGTPIAVQHVLGALSELGYAVDVLTYPVGKPVSMPGIEIFRVRNPFGITHVPIGFSLRKVALDALMIPQLRRMLKLRRYDCIHAVEEAAFSAVVLGRASGVPVVYDMQSSLPEQLAQHPLFRVRPVQWALKRCERWLLCRADAVIGSAGLAHTVRLAAPAVPVAEWEFPTTRHHVSPQEIAALRKRLELPAGARVVAYCGTFELYQGLALLMAAVPMVCEAVPDTVFVLVGGTEDDAAALNQLARRRGYAARLRVLTRQPRESVPAYLALADVLVSPRSYGENLPLKVFDYLAAGRPLVATDIPSHRTILDSDRALLVPASPRSLAKGVVRVLTDPAEAERLAAAASRFAREHLGWSRFVSIIEQIYERVCTGSGRRSR